MHKQRFTILLTVVVILVTIYSIYQFNVFSAATKQDKRVIVVLKSINVRLDFWQTVSAGAQAAAKEMGLDIDVQGPLLETDADDQIRVLEEAIEQKPQAIVVAPFIDERMPAVINRIREAGIQLVVIDTPLDLNPPTVGVSNNHVEAGRLAGESSIYETKGYPNVAIISDYPDSAISAERLAGIRKALSSYVNSILGVYYADNSEDKAYGVAMKLLSEDNPFNTFVTLNEPSTLGVAKALKERNKAGTIKLIGFDSSNNEIQLLEEGVLNAAIVQKPFNMGYLGVKTALKLIEGEDTDAVTYIESNIITQENMYLPENQKLLFPFIDNK
ncbi:substrate-binding domain-containing protein [Cohnella sp.]|uniref:substrate-binding domain-containing protein n=1 Tax=Cohnella sp. TaxID=1883426 RepID=UPI0035650E00